MKKINIISESLSKLSDKEAFKYYVSTFGAGGVDGFCSNTEVLTQGRGGWVWKRRGLEQRLITCLKNSFF